LALFRGINPKGQVFVIGLSATEEEISVMHDMLSPDVNIEKFQPDRLKFLDPYCITWQIAIEPVFHTSGEFSSR
jgi:hypothetical protein